jgi:hypothetical protein
MSGVDTLRCWTTKKAPTVAAARTAKTTADSRLTTE